MRNYRSGLALTFAALIACASQSPEIRTAERTSAGGCSVAPASLENLNPTNYQPDLPRTQPTRWRTDPYPLEGKQRQLEGRVLASFRIDAKGRATSVVFLRTDAPPLIEAAACRLLSDLRFIVPTVGVDASDTRPFLTTVRFCMSNCARVAAYAGTKDISVTGSPLPRDMHFGPPSKS